jgi:hypothetical protein
MQTLEHAAIQYWNCSQQLLRTKEERDVKAVNKMQLYALSGVISLQKGAQHTLYLIGEAAHPQVLA